MSSIQTFTMIASLLGGLALFLFGMNTMSDSLSKMTGGALNRLIELVTKNRFLAFLFGTALTAVVQSSSAITVLSVGLVNSRIIELAQSIGLIIGANLGTTATAWLLSLNAIDGESLLMTLIKPASFSPFLGIAGVALTMFARAEKKKTLGTAILGFAVMMIGMNLMSQGVSPLKEVPALQNMLVSFSAPVLGFLFAAAFTMLLQSSDATIGILQAFALSMGVTYGMAVPLVCGAQAGTCITAILASLGGSNNARRTALLNLFYNLFKVIPFMLIFYLLNGALHFSFLESGVGSIGIPLFHSLLNLAAAAVWLPLADVIVKLAKRAVPYSAEEKEEQANVLTMLDPILLSNPGFALDQADKAVLALGEAAGEAFTVLSHLKKGPEIAEKVRILCKRTDTFREQIDRYLAEISMKHLQEKEAARLSLLLCANAAFGKIGTITGRVMEKSREYSGSEDLFSEAEQMEANMFASAINEIVAFTITGFESKNPALSNMIQIYREAITEMNAMVTIRHIRRVHQKEGKTVYSTIFTDICYAEERLIDCCDSIADALIEYAGATGNESGIPQAADAEKRKRIKQLFLDKYDILHLDMQEETGSPL